MSADTITPDVRCERLSAAAVRVCAYAVEGCAFKGNRTNVAAHEELCDHVPRSVLREKILLLEKDVQDMRQQELKRELGHVPEELRLLRENSAIFRELQQEKKRMQQEKKRMQQALVTCAMGPQPAQAVLRVLYELQAGRKVYEIDREAAHGRSHAVY